jgi:glycosyltransferase involved in cell wall biosynthesis
MGISPAPALAPTSSFERRALGARDGERPRAPRLALVTDAWRPQTNGVAHTLARLVRQLEARGVEVLVLAPDRQRTLPLPSYPEIRLACDPWTAERRLWRFAPDAVHVATEGPLGAWMRARLAWRGLCFTTSFHTRFPEYVSARLPVPLACGYAFERWFHGRAAHTLVGTRSLMRELARRGVGRALVHWPRGVDTLAFRPDRRRADVYMDLPRPVWLYVGRVAVEKSLPDFLRLPLGGTKVVVGDGPQRAQLQRRFPEVVWRGFRYGDELAAHYASADCFVFPSRTETFGNVVLEALASGLPVAAAPSPGPLDLIDDGRNGALDADLQGACARAVGCTREAARASSLAYSWDACHDVFQNHLVPLRPAPEAGVAPSDAGRALTSPAPS